MASIDKLIERFRACPADFTWDELVRLLNNCGYVEKKAKGSRRKFSGKGRPSINLHEPHPGHIVKQYALREVREVLEREKLL